jgi:hypothetical protein
MSSHEQDSPKASAEIIDFTAYKNKPLIDVLESALADAKAGRIGGAILVVEREGHHHGVVVVGSYEDNARQVCGIAGEIFVEFLPKTLDRPQIIGKPPA